MQPARANPFANPPPQPSGPGAYPQQGGFSAPPPASVPSGYGAFGAPPQAGYGGPPPPSGTSGSYGVSGPPPGQYGAPPPPSGPFGAPLSSAPFGGMPPPPSGPMGVPPPPGAGPFGASTQMGPQAGGYPATQAYSQPMPPPQFGAPPSMAAPVLSSAGSHRMAHPDMLGPVGTGVAPMPHIDASLETSLKESDEFNAPSHFVRSSFSRLPSSTGVASKIRGPMGFVFQPLAPSPAGVAEPPTVNFSNVGSIVRCRRCRTYINPFVQWEASGRRWMCNLCGFSNETLNTYFGPLDASGRRADRYEHPELCNGSVDYIAPGEYMVRPPQPPAFLFLIEVTAGAVNSGMLDAVSNSIRELISEKLLPGGDRCMVGIMTFDTSIHFYNLNSSLKNPQMIVVNDFEEMFVPIAEEVLVPAYENEIAILSLLDALPRMFRSNKAAESCLGSAVKAASLGMKHVGGKLIVCASTIPSVGDLSLTSRKDNPKLLNTDREIELLKPSLDGYKELATELTKMQICCELFVATTMYMDLASIAPLAKNTAGDLRYYPQFNYATQFAKLRSELLHACTRPMGWEAVMRVRVSRGWKISKFFGHLYVRGVDLLVVPNCHSDQTFGIVIEPVENETADPNICVQFALLYTNSEAERRIRVHTMQLVSSPNAGEIYNTMDPEPLVSLLGNLAMEESIKSNLSAGRNLVHTTVQQIATTATSACEGLPNLAMFALGLLKSSMFRATNDVLADHRVALWSRFESIPLGMQTAQLYPRMFALHNLDSEPGGTVDGESGRVVLPNQLPLSVDQMTQDGILLLEDGESMMMWLGTAVSPDVLYSIFGVNAINQLNLETAEEAMSAANQSGLGGKISAIVQQLRQDRSPPYMSLSILPHEHPFSGKFFQSLVEDRTAGLQMTYPEFLQRIGVASGSAPTPPPMAGGAAGAPGMMPPTGMMPPMGMMPPTGYR